MGWHQVPEFESSASSQHDNPFASPKTQPTREVPVKLPSDDCLCRKMEKFNITLTEGYSTCDSETLMKLSAIFQDLEHIYHIQKNQVWGPFYFQNEATILQRHVFIAINIPYIFGEDIFIN